MEKRIHHIAIDQKLEIHLERNRNGIIQDIVVTEVQEDGHAWQARFAISKLIVLGVEEWAIERMRWRRTRCSRLVETSIVSWSRMLRTLTLEGELL